MARVGIAAGTWTAVSNRVSRRQANRWASQDEQKYYEQQGRAQAQAAPAPSAPPAPRATRCNNSRISPTSRRKAS